MVSTSEVLMMMSQPPRLLQILFVIAPVFVEIAEIPHALETAFPAQCATGVPIDTKTGFVATLLTALARRPTRVCCEANGGRGQTAAAVLLTIQLDEFVLLSRLLHAFLPLVVDTDEDENVQQQQEAADNNGDSERGVVALELTAHEAPQEIE